MEHVLLDGEAAGHVPAEDALISLPHRRVLKPVLEGVRALALLFVEQLAILVDLGVQPLFKALDALHLKLVQARRAQDGLRAVVLVEQVLGDLGAAHLAPVQVHVLR